MDEKNRVKHQKFMRLALSLARKAQGLTSPNPLVGAVVVKKGKIIGRGYHQKAGREHAEVIALDKAGRAASGSTLYVTLEPCCHFGQTPPCVEKIVAAGVREVIFAMFDPNPLNNGKGAQFLRRQGIKVTPGILQEEAKALNRPFIKYVTQKLPFVTVKVAQSLDGKIATSSGNSRWISSVCARKFAHKLRRQADAILVGVNTVLTDNPLLSCRNGAGLDKKQPKKVIVDTRLRLAPNAKIFSPRSPAQVIVATTRFAPRAKAIRLNKKARIMIVKNETRKVDLRDLLKRLAKEGITHILIEGGGEIIASALKKKLVDRMIMFISPKIIGGRQAPTAVEGKGVDKISQATILKDMQVKTIGAELMIEGRPA